MNQLIIDLNVIRRMQITCRQQTGVENKKPQPMAGALYIQGLRMINPTLLGKHQNPSNHSVVRYHSFLS